MSGSHAHKVQQDAAGLLSALHHQTCDLAALAAADARLAGVSLAAMINGLVFAGLSALNAWGMLVALLVWWAADSGLPLGPVFALLALIHVGVAVVLGRWSIRMAKHLEFRATRRQLGLVNGNGG